MPKTKTIYVLSLTQAPPKDNYLIVHLITAKFDLILCSIYMCVYLTPP